MAIKLTVMPLDMDPSSKPIIKIFNKEELTLGRLPSNDVVLNRPEVSGIHARLRIEHDEFGEVSKLFITDLGSSNGTLVEKNPLKARVEVQMMPNERIFIGSYVIKPTTLADEETHDSKTTLEAPKKNKDDNFQFASKTQAFDNIKFEAVKPDVEEDTEEEEERVVVNASSRSSTNAFSSIMFGNESEDTSESENETSVLRSMYTTPVADAHYREPEQRLSPFGQPHIDEEDEEEDYTPVSQRTVEAKPTWAQVKENFLEEKDELEEFEESEELEAEDDFNSTVVAMEMNTFVPPVVEPVVEAVRSEPIKTEPTWVEPVKSEPTAKLVERFSIRVTAGEQSENAFKIQAKAFTYIKGRVMHKGKPLSGVNVMSDAHGHTTTDIDGEYEFSRVLEDTPYSLTFKKDQYLIEPNSVKGKATVKGAEVVLQATRLYSIKGVISHNGQPLEGVVVDAGELGKKVTGYDGAYQFDNVPEGKEYDLVLSKEGYAFQS